MPYYSTASATNLGGEIGINEDLGDSGLRIDAEQRYTLRYGIR